jgi:hypothetical protein
VVFHGDHEQKNGAIRGLDERRNLLEQRCVGHIRPGSWGIGKCGDVDEGIKTKMRINLFPAIEDRRIGMQAHCPVTTFSHHMGQRSHAGIQHPPKWIESMHAKLPLGQTRQKGKFTANSVRPPGWYRSVAAILSLSAHPIEISEHIPTNTGKNTPGVKK